MQRSAKLDKSHLTLTRLRLLFPQFSEQRRRVDLRAVGQFVPRVSVRLAIVGRVDKSTVQLSLTSTGRDIAGVEFEFLTPPLPIWHYPHSVSFPFSGRLFLSTIQRPGDKLSPNEKGVPDVDKAPLLHSLLQLL